MRILLVEDQRKIADFIVRGLKEQRYAVDVAYDGEAGLRCAETNVYDLIILDIMLPKKDGITLCRELRAKGVAVPVLMLTAKETVDDKVTGLDAGADDYLVKPFSFKEFLARVRVLVRRKTNTRAVTLQVADLAVDQVRHTVTRAGKEIILTGTEYALLEYFMLHANEVVTRTMIAEHVWHEDFDRFSNIINVYINYLRNKIDKGFDSPLIHSVRGVGYILKEEE